MCASCRANLLKEYQKDKHKLAESLYFRLCEKAEVKNSLFIRDPDDWNRMVILGTNVGNIDIDELEEVERQFLGFSVITEEHDNPTFTGLLGRNSIYLDRLKFESTSTCELIVQSGVNNNSVSCSRCFIKIKWHYVYRNSN